MPSTFSWLDYCESEQRKALEVIRAFSDQGTLDELGIGTTRDALADLLFPGTSTIQTRSRYYLFIPWIYQNLEQELSKLSSISAANVEDRLRKKETGLINALRYSSDTEGTIGIEAGAGLKRLPSSVYWNALGVWGIRLFPGTQKQYHETLAAAAGKGRYRTGNNQVLASTANWHPGLPGQPEDFPSRAEFALQPDEAEYLQDRVMARSPDTFLAFLVDRGAPTSSIDFPWSHPQYSELPGFIQEQLRHCQNFSETIHGAALLYNFMLAQESGSSRLKEEYQGKLQGWAEMIRARRSELAAWNVDRLWRLAEAPETRVPEHSKRFIRDWLQLVFAKPDPFRLVEDAQARELIRHREKLLKKNLARLGNPRALELWSGKSGADRLDFRWGVVQRLIRDIRMPLQEMGKDA